MHLKHGQGCNDKQQDDGSGGEMCIRDRFNTLGNFYEYLPTRYKSGTESGLIGEVSLYAAK